MIATKNDYKSYIQENKNKQHIHIYSKQIHYQQQLAHTLWLENL